MALLIINKSNINNIIKILLLLYSQSFRYFLKKILETFKLLLIISEVSLREISNTN